ncbi:DNA/RNA non-specific endonuclease [Kordia sp. YSTF-M3]|uniref:DNA/RNA non-specific endonuclease n=1 Tax=Kordia aestuariivivens TaxID=2759037 RepID=A0ABR7Q6Y6_9FLAO|nr:DNA/RNA non-specific endonuclease [Kordia aestuariivivens]MBC8754332.1 DNA/RNA non-specific endonuclease [Kordia aestuariivivens]
MGAKALQRKEISNQKPNTKTNFGVIQLGKKLTPAKRLEALRRAGHVTGISKIKRVGKRRPKSLGGYAQTTVSGRKYYSRKDPTGRVVKFAGGLKYSKAARKATPKVPYKRKNDAAGHLIAHSFGGPPKFTDNFVAMNKTINSAGGAWGKMEGYIRQRLKQKNIEVWMSVKPHYVGKSKRPISIGVSLTFNRSPFKVKFNIATP